jgi:hypothetical protein
MGLLHIGVIASPTPTANTIVQTGAIPTRAGVTGVAGRDDPNSAGVISVLPLLLWMGESDGLCYQPSLSLSSLGYFPLRTLLLLRLLQVVDHPLNCIIGTT